MQKITIKDYNLSGVYKVEEQNGKFYKFISNETQKVIVPDSDIKKHVDIFVPLKKESQTVKSYKYNLSGDYKVEEQNGIFYKFTDNAPVSVSESDIGEVKGFDQDRVLVNDTSSSDDEGDVFFTQNVTSDKYKLSGSYTVEKNDDNYIFTKPTVYVPESDIVIDDDNKKEVQIAGKPRNRKTKNARRTRKTKNTPKNSRRYSRRN